MTVQYNPKTGGRGIEWTDRTENPVGGCMHGCRWKMPDGTEAICYAEELAESGVASKAYPHGFAHHYWRGDKGLRDLVKGKEPEFIFCDSMSDLFAANVPEEHVNAVLDAMTLSPHHTYQSLTKAAPQLLKYVDRLPRNLWVGVSSPPDVMFGKKLSDKQQESMLKRSLEVLEEIAFRTGNIVWMSCEPVSWDLAKCFEQGNPLDWAVIGAASRGRQYFQPEAWHVLGLLNVLDASGTPVFYKGNIRPLIGSRPWRKDELDRWREDYPCYDRRGLMIPAVQRRQERCEALGWTKSRRCVTT